MNTNLGYFAVDQFKVEIHVDEICEKYVKRYESKWKCNKCVESFTSSRRLRQHKKAAHNKIEDLRQYNYTHNKIDGTYVCNTCDIETDTKNEMENHVQVHEDTYDCNVCSEKFGSAYKYATHVHSHDGDDFKCPICSYKTNRRTSISKHINMLHLHKYIYNCNFCGKGFDDVLIYEEHENSHKGVSEPFSCIVCNKIFPFSRYLLTHQKRNHTVKIDGILLPNQCDICKKIFSKPNTLESHRAKHESNSNSVQKHLCDTCGKGFARKDKLVIHKRVHTGEKPYKCSYCSKSFTKKDYLIMHERIHSGEKPYSCEHCGKCFNQGAPLRIHVRSHTGERPYVCFICNNGFISKGALAVHLKACNNR